MKIHGINKLTLLDFPEHTACTLFAGGCNFRCPFCQNGSLVLAPEGEPVIDEEWLFAFLKKRRNVLQGVCITGGEPTLNRDLDAFIRSIRKLGYRIKLDTNGYTPEVLKRLLDEELLDGVAMDIKSSPQGYARAAGLPPQSFELDRIEDSIRLLEAYGKAHPRFYYEYRTTLVRGLHSVRDMGEIGRWLAGAPHYFLQRYEDSECVIEHMKGDESDSGLGAFTPDEMREMADMVKAYMPSVQLRGV